MIGTLKVQPLICRALPTGVLSEFSIPTETVSASSFSTSIQRLSPRGVTPIFRPSSGSSSRFRLPPWSFKCKLARSEEHTSELQSQSNLVCRLLLEKKKDIDHLRRSKWYTLVSALHQRIQFRCYTLCMPAHLRPRSAVPTTLTDL